MCVTTVFFMSTVRLKLTGLKSYIMIVFVTVGNLLCQSALTFDIGFFQNTGNHLWDSSVLQSRIPHSKKNFLGWEHNDCTPPSPPPDSIYHLKFNRKISVCTVMCCHQIIDSNITSYSVFFFYLFILRWLQRAAQMQFLCWNHLEQTVWLITHTQMQRNK